MRKALTLCLLLGASSLLMVGCTTTPAGNGGNNSSNSSAGNNNSGNSSAISASECLPNCEALGDLKDLCVAGCWMSEAERTNNPDVCLDHLEDGLLQASCVMAVAAQAEDPGMCARLDTDNADLCYSSYASETGDKSVCNRISDDFMKSVCLDDFESEE